MTSNVTKAEHTRRQFLSAVVAVGACAAVTGATATPALAAADVYEVDLVQLGIAPVSYRTNWPTGTNVTVNVWDNAFRKAIELLARNGGGRLIVPGNDVPYYLRDCHVFDLPSVSVHLGAGSEVMLVGPKNPYLGAPIGFYGGLGDGVPPRFQRDFAAVNGPGKIGYPAVQLEYYERGNGLGFSYIKTVHVEGVEVPCAPRFAMTAQYGCNDVTFRGNRIGYTGTPEEIKLAGHAVMGVSGGLFNDKTGAVDRYAKRTTVQILNNTVGRGHRAAYLEHCGKVQVLDNKFGPLGSHGVTLGNILGASVSRNTFDQISRGAHGTCDALQFVDVSGFIWVAENHVKTRTHRHCLLSRDSTSSPTSGVIHSRLNKWTRGTRAVFAGSPWWDSSGDTMI